jgi:polyketide synthase 13
MNRDRVRRWLVEWVATNHGLEPSEVSSDRPLEEYGLSSRDAAALAADLGDELGDEFPPTLLWEQPTIDDLARLAAGEGMRHQPSSPRPSPVTEPVAVIGVGCRFPGAIGPEQFWRMLLAGHDAVSPAPPGRGDDDVPRWGGFLQDVAGFDAAFFGVAPREAELMDPQQRLLLEVTHEALVHAGIAPRSLSGSATGVFTGISTHDYAQLTLAEPGEVDMWTATGAAGSVAANRLSYVYDLRGPSMAVDTACSSSLVAVHHAVTALRAGEADLALAGGANVMLVPGPTQAFARGGVLARDGRCKPFDAAADGISRGEGCGVVVLKRLADAERDGDRVLAVIRATTVNSDGRSNGLTAPNPVAQEALLAHAYESAAVDPATVDYVETHGTGTFLGDPIEAGALGAVLGAGRQLDLPLLLGSVKANIAHTEAAAGIAGLIKVVLAMEHGLIPPTPHFTTPNPHIPFERARLRVVTEPTPWPRYGDTARAGVSAFGFGGTNAHVVLEAPDRAAAPPSRSGPHIAILSAPSPERLRDTASRLADWFDASANRDLRLADVAYTLARRDNGDRYRTAVVATDLVDLASRLRVTAIDVPVVGEADDNGPVFVFSGYGSQWPGMAAALLATEPAFAAAVDELDASFVRHASFSLREALDASRSPLPCRVGSRRVVALRRERERALPADLLAGADGDRAPHRHRERRSRSRGHGSRHLPVPRDRPGLRRHRLPLPDRRGRPGVRGTLVGYRRHSRLRPCRPHGQRRARRWIQRGQRRHRPHRHVHRPVTDTGRVRLADVPARRDRRPATDRSTRHRRLRQPDQRRDTDGRRDSGPPRLGRHPVPWGRARR